MAPILTIFEDLRDRNNGYLKYTVRIFRAPAATPDQLVRRQYVSASGIHGAPSRPNVRKLDIPELPETGDWPPDDHAWAMLAPVNKNTAVERLCTGTVIVGRYIGMDSLSRVTFTISPWMNRNVYAFLRGLLFHFFFLFVLIRLRYHRSQPTDQPLP
jgi:hypothetical protein